MTKAAELAKMGEVLTNSQIGGRRNMVINGAMQVAQRGTSFTYGGGAYNLDRFYALDGTDGTFTVEQSTTAPTDFTNSLKVTITTADSSVGASQYASLRQNIEGFNCSQLNWGSSDAQTVTLSFYVRSSVTGTFGGSLLNAGTRSYPFTYTISSADTWERILVTIDGDTTGTWATDNTVGINVNFNIGNGSTYTNTAGTWASGSYYGATGEVNLIETTNATWFLTGLQVEVGEQATPFEHRSYGEELALCQRYYTVIADGAIASGFCPIGVGVIYNSSTVYCIIELPCEMRAPPSIEIVDATGYYQLYSNSTADPVNDFILSKVSPSRVEFYNSSDVSRVAGHATFIRTANASAKFALKAEI